ncbi:hypothetical protein JQR85_16035 [Stutzerimonas urumqiensis]|uniref:hypothetical protein n=1 Tax=Stutzerimonas urumqiensis TaxID=638269 RepID=UPI003DA4013F
MLRSFRKKWRTHRTTLAAWAVGRRAEFPTCGAAAWMTRCAVVDEMLQENEGPAEMNSIEQNFVYNNEKPLQ